MCYVLDLSPALMPWLKQLSIPTWTEGPQAEHVTQGVVSPVSCIGEQRTSELAGEWF